MTMKYRWCLMKKLPLAAEYETVTPSNFVPSNVHQPQQNTNRNVMYYLFVAIKSKRKFCTFSLSP